MELKGWVNVYVCEGGILTGKPHVTLVTLLNHGVTPAFMACPECGKAATSGMYRFQWQGGTMHVTHCFFRPRVLNDNMKKNDGLIRHLFAAGLLFGELQTGLENCVIYDKVDTKDTPEQLRHKLHKLWGVTPKLEVPYDG